MGVRTGNPRGRPAGSKNRRTKEAEAATAEAAEAIEAALSDAFEGDAHALLMAVYKDQSRDIAVRLDAAKAAIRFEKPALQNMKHQGDAENPVEQVLRWAQSTSEATPDPSKS